MHFRLEELSVISGDQLEKVAMRDDGELDELRKELETEQEMNAALQGKKEKKEVEMRGIDPRAFRMQSGRSTAELHPHFMKRLCTELV